MAPTITEKLEALTTEIQQVADEHNKALEDKNRLFVKFTELQASIKTLQELQEPVAESEVVTE
jgi:hypothetical protein|tara:strand:- start:219 stop:407 length:189 start_codon:yes stop_codon:yes gene_type:complete